MAQIRPFRALRYDPARVPISLVATQPYDKITPAMQELYYAASPHNLVRIILGKRFATDGPKDNTYTRAAGFFSDWRKQGVFLRDSEPSIYRYSQSFTVPGNTTQLRREGFIAIGKIEDYSDGIIFRHEQTLSKPKADRLDLLRATRAHFGQIFMLYSDPKQEIEQALYTSTSPDLELSDEYEVMHRVWRISHPETIAFVQAAMEDKKLIIADGHHRYETALNYRNESRSADLGHSGSSPYEYVMMTLVKMDNPGLLILPTHRVVHGLSSVSMDRFREAAIPYFTVDEVDPSFDSRRAACILREAGHTGTSILAVARDRAFLLSRPKSPDFAFSGISLRQQGLDVVQLHKCLLERALGISEEAIRNQTHVSYVRDISESMSLVREGQADIAFLMNPARIQQVRDIAFSGEVLPQKSTDFYPKLLDGLTVYALD